MANQGGIGVFRIFDGRDSFFQWDLNRRLIVEDNSINEVHFSNKTDDSSLVCVVRTEDGLRVADVPNILLQTDWSIRAYAYCTDHTIVEEIFKVHSRNKPADYIYTETEIKNYDDLKARVDEIELNAKIPEATAANKGQVLSINADGNKTWTNQYVMDGTLTPGYQYNSATNSHLFVIDATNNMPALGTYYFNSGTVYIKVVKDGVTVSQRSFAAVKQIQVININPSGENSGIVFDTIYVNTKQRVSLYFEDNSDVIDGTYTANTFYKTTLQYSPKEVDNLLNQKLDSPTNTGIAGQVPVYQEDGSTMWGDVLTQVDIDAKGYQTAEQVQAAINTALGVIENGTY